MSEEFNEENVTMADLEDHFDDANPWNVVQSYLEKGTVLPGILSVKRYRSSGH